jgi:hypothetical protein
MYTDYYLQFDDEAQATSVLYTEEPSEYDEEGNPIAFYMAPNFLNIDTLGIIYIPEEVIDPENPPTPIPYDGWYVNVRLMDYESPDTLEPFAIEPPHPQREWA